jgi:excisionase family DNA binding protein
MTIERATLKVSELATLLGISTNKAYEGLETKQIPAKQLGRKWIISESEIRAIYALGEKGGN